MSDLPYWKPETSRDALVGYIEDLLMEISELRADLDNSLEVNATVRRLLDEAIAENDRLRDALRAFAAAWEVSMKSEHIDPHLSIEYGGGVIHIGISPSDYLEARHLRAAHLALHPDADTGGDGDEAE